jgi:hypothetical protein
MKMYRVGFIAATLAANALAVMSAHAEVLNIPWSAALQTTDNPACTPYQPFAFGSSTLGGQCYVDFPVSLPVGRTIQQIAVLHGSDNTNPANQPYFEALLDVVTLLPAIDETEKFLWTSTAPVPTGLVDRHQLMAQAKGIYFDQFQVLGYTQYHVIVSLDYGAFVSGIEVTYY